MKRKAFTLIELLVVIVIIGILATIGIASFKDYKAKAALARGKAFENQLTKHLFGKLIPEQKKLVLQLDLDEGSGSTTADSSGNNISFSVTSSNWRSDTPDGSNSSLHGVQGFFSQSAFDQTQLSETNQVTVSVYVKPFDLSATSTRGIHSIGAFNTWSMYINEDGYPHLALPYTDRTIQENKTIILNQWNHIVGTYDGTTVRVYLNGELVEEQPISYTFPSGNYNLLLGDWSAFTSNDYLIDRIKIFPIAPDEDFY